jgi:hypothetical protein
LKTHYAHLSKSLGIDKKSIEGSFLDLRAQLKATIKGVRGRGARIEEEPNRGFLTQGEKLL